MPKKELPSNPRRILADGKLPTAASIIYQHNRLTKGTGRMSPAKVIAFINLSAGLVGIRREKDIRKSALSRPK